MMIIKYDDNKAIFRNIVKILASSVTILTASLYCTYQMIHLENTQLR